MKTINQLSILMILLGIMHTFQLKAQDKNKLVSLSKETLVALNSGDAEAYMKHKHANFTQFLDIRPNLERRPDVRVIKQQFEDGRKFNFQISDQEVALYGNSAVLTALQTGSIHFEDGTESSGLWKVTAVWIKENGEWQQVHLHVSKVRE